MNFLCETVVFVFVVAVIVVATVVVVADVLLSRFKIEKQIL